MPVASYTYQDTAALKEIAPELIQSLALTDPIFNYFPITEHEQAKLRWYVEDNYRGLMSLRGYDGAPTRVLRPGANLFEELPGVYGEFGQLSEQELTERAQGFPANMMVPMPVADMVRMWMKVLATRYVQRMKQTAWALALTRVLNVSLPGGGVGHRASFAGQALTVNVLWSNLLTATPLNDLAQVQFLYGRGTSNNFGGQAEAWMTGKTARYLLNNRNPNDLGGIRAQYGQTITNSIAGLNGILLDQGAPKIMIYEDSIQLDTAPGTAFVNNNYQLLIPDGVVWIVAARPGNEKPGEFMMTRHVVDGGGTKPYAFVEDHTKSTPYPSVPPKIIVQMGFNGGPVQTRPTQTVTMTVA